MLPGFKFPRIVSCTIVLLYAMCPAFAESEIQPNSAQIQIALKKEVRVTGRYYSLADIAVISTNNKDLQDRLGGLKIGMAPRVRYIDGVSKLEIESIVERQFPGLHKSIQWDGEDAVKVRALAKSYESIRYIEEARHHLSDWLAKRYNEVEILHKGGGQDLQLPVGDIRLAVRLQENVTIKPRMSVWVDIYVSETHYQTIPVWFEVKVMAPVYVTTAELRKGHVLSKTDVKLQKMNIAKIASEPADLKEVAMLRLKNGKKSGEVISIHDLEKKPDVRMNDAIQVKAVVGNVEIETTVIAEQDGWLGDVITVRKINTEVRFNVRVVGEKLALAEEE